MPTFDEISDLMNNIVASSTYIPTSADLKWTKETISMRNIWGTPRAACVFFFDHKKKEFRVALNGSPTDKQLLDFARIRTNLIVLGYNEGRKDVIADTVTVEDIYLKIGLPIGEDGITEDDERILDEWRSSQ